jgi:hypothetical protein
MNPELPLEVEALMNRQAATTAELDAFLPAHRDRTFKGKLL